MASIHAKKYIDSLKQGIVQGFGWTIGATIGFAFVSTVVVLIFRGLGGLPVVGNFIADIVQATNASLVNRTPILQDQ